MGTKTGQPNYYQEYEPRQIGRVTRKVIQGDIFREVTEDSSAVPCMLINSEMIYFQSNLLTKMLETLGMSTQDAESLITQFLSTDNTFGLLRVGEPERPILLVRIERNSGQSDLSFFLSNVILQARAEGIERVVMPIMGRSARQSIHDGDETYASYTQEFISLVDHVLKAVDNRENAGLTPEEIPGPSRVDIVDYKPTTKDWASR